MDEKIYGEEILKNMDLTPQDHEVTKKKKTKKPINLKKGAESE